MRFRICEPKKLRPLKSGVTTRQITSTNTNIKRMTTRNGVTDML